MRSLGRIAARLASAALLAASLPCAAGETPTHRVGVALAADAGGVRTLEDLMRGMAGTAGVVADFREVQQLALLSAPLEVDGTIYFAPPDRLVRITRPPNASRLRIDGTRFAFRNEAGGDEVDLSGNPIARAFVDGFLALFAGDLGKLRDRYEPRFASDGPRWTLALTPRGRPLSDLVARITLAGEGRALARMELVETGGDRTLTSFEHVDVDHRFAADELERIFAAGGTSAAR